MDNWIGLVSPIQFFYTSEAKPNVFPSCVAKVFIMQINGINGAQPVNPTSQVESAKATQATSITTPTDQVDISAEAELNSQTIEMIDQLQIQDLPEIRTDRVAQIREAIESGTYETEEKLNVAIDRLLDEIG
ncbi:MAG: flagellar biosynthesis anti-sigma factor FlgM [Rhodopirellula sp.]|nr:flagellar biosynthesis anti-sigma factor FlgM [Rhodopirellula sp.]